MIECQNCDNCKFVGGGNNKIYYEAHVTVKHKESFVDDCCSIGVKPVIIDMGEGVPTHSMTSTTLESLTDSDAIGHAHFIAKALENIGYEVQRVKVETVPWHPKAPDPEPHQYFETHIPINLPCDTHYLEMMAKFLKLHKSRNLLKRSGKNVQMLTYRNAMVNGEKFLGIVESLKKSLTENGFTYEKVITEFAIYDTNVEMDKTWLYKSPFPK